MMRHSDDLFQLHEKIKRSFGLLDNLAHLRSGNHNLIVAQKYANTYSMLLIYETIKVNFDSFAKSLGMVKQLSEDCEKFDIQVSTLKSRV